MKNIFLHHWKKYLFGIIYIIVIFLIYMFVNGDWRFLIFYSDALFIGGFSLLCISLLVLLNSLGTFDLLSYGLSRRKEGTKNYYEYSEKKRVERSRKKYTFMPHLEIAILALIASIIISLFI